MTAEQPETPATEEEAAAPTGPGTVHILGEGGGIFELQLPLHEAIEQRLATGHLRRVQPDGSPYVEEDRPLGVPSLPTTRPALSANKPEWVAWGVAQGLKPDEAEALTKADLIERFGATPADGDAPAE